MNINFDLNWKTVLALGASTSLVILVFKVDGVGAEKVLAQLSGAFERLAGEHAC